MTAPWQPAPSQPPLCLPKPAVSPAGTIAAINTMLYIASEPPELIKDTTRTNAVRPPRAWAVGSKSESVRAADPVASLVKLGKWVEPHKLVKSMLDRSPNNVNSKSG